MIQVCSQCGTHWNVRERQRSWCPRCQGALLAPFAGVQHAGPRWNTAAPGHAGQRAPTQQPPGYRWIAVRPGPPPPPRRRRRPLGPTPRYAAIPRWGLVDQSAPAEQPRGSSTRTGPSASRVQVSLQATMMVLGVAGVAHAARYLLLVFNRDTLLHPLVAWTGLWLGVVASLAAIVVTAGCAVVLTRWLIARRAAAFAHRGLPDPRRVRALRLGCLAPMASALAAALAAAVVLSRAGQPVAPWAVMLALAGCVVPLVALVWVLVYVIELAKTEDHYLRMRKSIWVWWVLTVLSAVASVFATVTSSARDAQGIANNTVAMMTAYLLALVAVAATSPLFDGFERKPVERPAHRWVVLDDDGRGAGAAAPSPDSPDSPDDDSCLEAGRQETAA